jgi:replication factor C small subunit
MPTINKNLSNLMWVEKYRPLTLNEVINQKEIVNALRQLINIPDELPHLLFAGPPGVGKTTTALCIARQLLG